MPEEKNVKNQLREQKTQHIFHPKKCEFILGPKKESKEVNITPSFGYSLFFPVSDKKKVTIDPEEQPRTSITLKINSVSVSW